MFSQCIKWVGAFALVGMTASAAAHDGPLDPFFGDGGMRNYGFQSYQGSGRNDRATVACPGPNGTLVVAGEASDANRLVTMRLLPNGDYDPSYGAGGRVSVEFAMTQEYFSAGLCLPDNKILLARRVRIGAADEMNIQLIRLDATSGQLDHGFGQNGATWLDLDTWQSGLQRTEAPLALTLLDAGEVLLTGHVRAEIGGIVAFAARVTQDGYVPVARVYTDVPYRATTDTMMTAMLGGDGTIWGVVEGQQPGSTRVTAFRVRFDRMTLQWLDVPDALPDVAGDNIYSGRGVRVRADVLAVPMIRFIRGSNPQRFLPGVMIYRAAGKVYVPLPEPVLPGETLTLSGQFALQSAIPLPAGRVLLAFAVTRVGELTSQGMHLAVVHVGTAIGSDGLDKDFGIGGAQTAAFRPLGGGCPASVAQDFSALVLWNGAPTLVGNVDASCNNHGGGIDYLVARLITDRYYTGSYD